MMDSEACAKVCKLNAIKQLDFMHKISNYKFDMMNSPQIFLPRHHLILVMHLLGRGFWLVDIKIEDHHDQGINLL